MYKGPFTTCDQLAAVPAPMEQAGDRPSSAPHSGLPEAHLEAQEPQQVLRKLAAVRAQDGALEHEQQRGPECGALALLHGTLQVLQHHLHQAVQLLRKQVRLGSHPGSSLAAHGGSRA